MFRLTLRPVLQEVLEDKGYVVLPASDLSRAVDWMSRCKPDLLLVRPFLSGISGTKPPYTFGPNVMAFAS